MRKDEEYGGNIVIRMDDVERRTETKMDSVNVDLRKKGLSGETHNRVVWRRQLVRYIDPPRRSGKRCRRNTLPEYIQPSMPPDDCQWGTYYKIVM